VTSGRAARDSLSSSEERPTQQGASRSTHLASFFIIAATGIILGILFILIARRQNLQPIETRAIFLVASIARTKVSTTPAIVSASPGVISPRAVRK